PLMPKITAVLSAIPVRPFVFLGSDRARDPAVDADALAGDVGGAVGGEEGDDGGDLLAGAVALQRHAGAALLRRGQAVDPARQDVVHADVVAGVGVDEDLGEGGEAGAEDGGG